MLETEQPAVFLAVCSKVIWETYTRKAAAAEWAGGINVATVIPWDTDTPFLDARRKLHRSHGAQPVDG